MSGLEDLTMARRAAALIAVVSVACVVLVLLAEIGVRARHWLKFGSLWGIESTYTVDPESGLRTPIPGASFGSVSINSLGFRSPELEVAKGQQQIRLAFLGGSTTYCAEVSSDELTWPHLVWSAFRDAWDGLSVDYVNGGVPGYGVSNSLQ